MIRLLAVFGTRPEAIKMSELIKELKGRRSVTLKVAITGQHKDMLIKELSALSIPYDYDLKIMEEGQSLSVITEKILRGLSGILKTEELDAVIVHGDTASAFCAALAAFYSGLKVVHIEAGLRTHDLKNPYPEEFYRRAIAIIAEYHFAPGISARSNLISEGVDEDKIFVTGNTVIDTLIANLKRGCEADDFSFLPTEKVVLLTAHRRESIGEPLRSVFRAVRRVCDEFENVKVIYPAHKNPEVRRIAEAVFSGNDRISVIEPCDSVKFHNLLQMSYLVITDSGGIQEEAAFLGKPLLIVREKTERAEALSFNAKLVGTKEEDVYEEFRALVCDSELHKSMSVNTFSFGDGGASRKIADSLEAKLSFE